MMICDNCKNKSTKENKVFDRYISDNNINDKWYRLCTRCLTTLLHNNKNLKVEDARTRDSYKLICKQNENI